MRNLVLLLGVGLLSGCLSNMERITGETKESVNSSNKLIGETKDGAVVAEALHMMRDRHVSWDLRVTAAETAAKMGQEDRVWRYAGMPAPLHYNVASRNLDGKEVNIPNVAMVSELWYADSEKPDENVDYELVVAMKDRDLYEVQSFSALNTLTLIAQKVKSPGITDTDMDTYRVTTLRMIPLAASLIGGVRVKSLKESLRKNHARTFEKPLKVRMEAARLIMELCGRLSLSEEDKSAAASYIESRLGVSVSQ